MLHTARLYCVVISCLYEKQPLAHLLAEYISYCKTVPLTFNIRAMYREPCSSKLQQFVQDRVTQRIIPGYDYADEARDWSNYLFGEKQMILVAIHSDILKLETHEVRQTYIESQQAYFSTQIAAVMTFMEDHEAQMPPALVQAYNLTIDTLQSLLTQIQFEYTKYFDLQRILPRSQWQAVRKDIAKKIKQVRSRMHNPCIDARLLEIGLKPYEVWSKEGATPMNYEQLIYANTLFAELMELDLEGDIDCQLRNILVKLNFNTEDFFAYAVDNLTAELSGFSNNQRLEKLAHFEKIFSLLKMKTGKAFTHDNMAVDVFLLNLVQLERQFIDTVAKINATAFTLQAAATPEERKAKFSPKISFNETINVFAAFSKAMVDAGYLSAQHTMDIIRVLSQNYKTMNREDLSEDSLRAKFYVIDQPTKVAVINMLNNVLDSAANLKTSKSGAA